MQTITRRLDQCLSARPLRHHLRNLTLCIGTLILIAGCDNSQPEPEQLYNKTHSNMLPVLAIEGPMPVGVRTIEIVNPDQLNIATRQIADRSLLLEIWYPARNIASMSLTQYDNETRLGQPFSLQANAYRDAEIMASKEKWPLVVISHGHTGYRTLMFYLAEHLASHGYIVAAIDHTDSTNADVDVANNPRGGAPSTLYNRSRDQQFTLDYLTSAKSFVKKHIDTERAGLIGYSMGAYGAVNTIGGCYSFTEAGIARDRGISDPTQLATLKTLLNSCAGGQYSDIVVDAKWRAVMAFAPWGNQFGLFDKDALAKITVPLMYIAGEFDDVSIYPAIEDMFQHTGGDHTYLLTYLSARHNVAPHPAPKIAYQHQEDLGHYYESAWDTQKLNHNNKHFALAMMNCHIKQLEQACGYLKLHGDSNQIPVDGVPTKPWPGFADRYSAGMRWAHK
ncbi:acetylhydrolase [Porticoccaceae bacterium]|nr:acetylhydrolase [Porticoccaceae bacterium]MDG2115574.1 acetylhydrolase [Porticoccaceae bacterium]